MVSKEYHERERRAFWWILVAALAIGCGKNSNLNPSANDCDYQRDGYAECLRLRPCASESTLVATTSGSPSSATCPNRYHKMRVEPVTRAGEEIAALVFCECVIPGTEKKPAPEESGEK